MVAVRQGDSITTTVRRMEFFEGSGSRGSFSGFLRAEEEAFGLCAGSGLVVVELEIYETERWIEKKKPKASNIFLSSSSSSCIPSEKNDHHMLVFLHSFVPSARKDSKKKGPIPENNITPDKPALIAVASKVLPSSSSSKNPL